MKHMDTRGHGHLWQLVSVLCAGLLTAALLSAWSGPAPRRPVTTGRPAHPAAAVHDMAGGQAATAGTAADRAVWLQALLGQHTVLASDLMRSRIRGDDDFVQAADAALSRNTDAMTTLVGQLFG